MKRLRPRSCSSARAVDPDEGTYRIYHRASSPFQRQLVQLSMAHRGCRGLHRDRRGDSCDGAAPMKKCKSESSCALFSRTPSCLPLVGPPFNVHNDLRLRYQSRKMGPFNMEFFDTVALRVRACGTGQSNDVAGAHERSCNEASRAVFIVNLRTENWIGPEARRDMMWQHFLRLPVDHARDGGRARDWVDVRLPLDDFYLTYRGRLVENETDMGERLESIGISVASPGVEEDETRPSSSRSTHTAPGTDVAVGDVHFCLDIGAVWLERQGLRRAQRAR